MQLVQRPSPNEEPPTDKNGEGVAKQGTDTFAEPQRKSKCVAVQQGDECRKACMIKLDDWTLIVT